MGCYSTDGLPRNMKFASTYNKCIYTPEWKEALCECLAQERNTIHWTKKCIYIGSKSIGKLKQIPHLHIFASVCQKAHIDFTPHLLPIAMVVNATFVENFRSCAKELCSYEFSSHLPMEQIRMQMCFFVYHLHTGQTNEQICFFAQRLLKL